jgi:hypothetical protein
MHGEASSKINTIPYRVPPLSFFLFLWPFFHNYNNQIYVLCGVISKISQAWKFKITYIIMSIIRMIKSRRMRWAEHVARMGRRGMHIEYWWEDQDVGGWAILKWILER